MATEASNPQVSNPPGDSVQASVSGVTAPTRRSRISLACQSCRSRKTKCDGNQPACSTCRHLKIDCVYARWPSGSSARQFTSRAKLASKVRELERQLHAVGDTPNEDRVGNHLSAPIHSAQDSLLGDCPSVHDSDTVRLDECGDESDQEAIEDAHAARVFQDQHDSEFGYFGPSSNHAFFRAVSRCFVQFMRNAPLQHNQSEDLTTTMMLNDEGIEINQSTPNRLAGTDNSSNLVLPAMSESLMMIDRFFATTAATYPFIGKASLITSLKEMATGVGQPGSWAKKALIHIVFAHSCSAVGDVRSDVYFRESLRCVVSETLKGVNIRLIQALLLVTSYQQQHSMSVRSWTFHALAVKAAFQLGLHSPSSYKELSPLDSELSKRLWYSLINQDRMLCMCLGRPCLIPSHYICTSRPEDPRSAHRISAIMHDYQLESLLHHNHQIDLYCIVAAILSEIYQHNVEREEPASTWSLLASRLRLFQSLEDWSHKLDARLKLITSQEVDTISSLQKPDTRFRLSLTMHYYRALIVLNGPILTQLLENAIGSSQEDKATDSLVEQCIPTLRSDVIALENLLQMLSVVSRADNFLNQSSLWWLCNHSSSILAMHLFSLTLLFHVQPILETLTGVSVIRLRSLLEKCLDNMKLLQRTSVLFRQARGAIVRYTKKLDMIMNTREIEMSTTLITEPNQLYGLDFAQCEHAKDLLGQPEFDLLLGDGLYY